jgi:hypothetical protein
MARIELPPEHLSDYERAICYYTLPKIAHPITFGLIIIYGVCLLEAVGVIAYGVFWDQDTVIKAGAVALAGIIVFGIVAFTARALLNDVRQRRALAVARGIPDAIADLQDIPDPFAGHVLLRHPLHTRGDLFPCTDNDGNLVYFVESSPSSPWWKVKDPQDNEVIRVRVESASSSFTLGGAVPSRLAVYAGGEEIAQIRRLFTFTAPTILVQCMKPESKTYTVRHGDVSQDKRLVGRIYYLHHSLYLDMEQAAFHEAILGLFITMT